MGGGGGGGGVRVRGGVLRGEGGEGSGLESEGVWGGVGGPC